MPGLLHANASTDTKATPLPWEELEKVLNDRSFKSKEELFQLFHLFYLNNKGVTVLIDEATIARLRKEIQTIFPLADCKSILMQDSTVTFIFAKPQNVAVPNTWRQASLHISDKLVLQIYENKPINTKEKDGPKKSASPLHFKVIEGSIDIHFSFLLRLFGGQLRDANGNELVYQIDNLQQISRLTLKEIIPLHKNQLQILPPASGEEHYNYQWVDILHPDFPSEKDIGFADNRISLMATEVELLPQHMISINTQDPYQDKKTWYYFSTMLSYFKNYRKTGLFSQEIDYVRSFSYHFEEKQMQLSKGFQDESLKE